MMSSTKSGGQHAQKMVKIVRVVPDISSLTNRQTHRHTHTHVLTTILRNSSGGRSKNGI